MCVWLHYPRSLSTKPLCLESEAAAQTLPFFPEATMWFRTWNQTLSSGLWFLCKQCAGRDRWRRALWQRDWSSAPCSGCGCTAPLGFWVPEPRPSPELQLPSNSAGLHVLPLDPRPQHFCLPSRSWGLPPGLSGKESTCSDTGDAGSIPGSGRSPGGGHGNPLQYSCLENPMHREAWRATVHGLQESNMTEQQNHHHKCLLGKP